MQRNIQQITQQFVDRLPDNDQFYRLDELRSWGFPSFLVKRIRIELERNLEESLIIPRTDWANTQSDAVQNAWQKFVNAIRAQARLPASYGKTVIETAVADILEILVQPRKNIPKIIFSQSDQLSYDEVRKRTKSVVVYRHFARLIPRYIQKKELNKLSKARCRKVIAKADEKLTARYSPLNWAQMLEPLFKLVDGEIDTNLLRLFFEDKNKPRVARKFDLMNNSLTRAELIEVLSSPELLNFEGYEDDQSMLFEDQPDTTRPEQESSGLETSDEISTEEEEEEQDRSDKTSTEAIDETKRSVGTADQEDKSESPKEEIENSLNSRFARKDEQISGVDEQESSLYKVFRNMDDEEIDRDEIAAELAKLAKGQQSLADEKPQDKQQSTEEGNTVDTNPGPDKAEESESKKEESQNNGQEKSSEKEDVTPIWMRYMSEEEIAEHKKKEQEKADEEAEEEFIDDPVIDLTNEDASDEEIETLENQLSGDREFFVEEIFRGSERAYHKAVENIAAYNNWREVSKYIEEEIFKRNLVDMYSEAAISFTDQLQNYFLKK